VPCADRESAPRGYLTRNYCVGGSANVVGRMLAKLRYQRGWTQDELIGHLQRARYTATRDAVAADPGTRTQAEHRAAAARGARAIAKMIREHVPFWEVAYHCGGIVHEMARAFPPRADAATASAASRSSRFLGYGESALGDPETGVSLWNRKGSVEAGETRSHTLFWLSSLKEMGTPDFSVTADTPLYAVFKDKGGARTYLAYNARSSAIHVTFSTGKSVDVPPRSLVRTR